MEKDPVLVKRKASQRLLAVPGVAGLGVPRGRLTVYLAEDTPAVRQTVVDTLRDLECADAVDFVFTGAFRAQR